MPGKFVVTKDSRGTFRFTVHGARGQVIARSGPYTTKAAALRGITSLQKAAATATVEDRAGGSKATSTRRAPSRKPGIAITGVSQLID